MLSHCAGTALKVSAEAPFSQAPSYFATLFEFCRQVLPKVLHGQQHGYADAAGGGAKRADGA